MASSHPDPQAQLNSAVDCFVTINGGNKLSFGIEPRCRLQKFFTATAKAGITGITRIALVRGGLHLRDLYNESKNISNLDQYQIEDLGIKERDVLAVTVRGSSTIAAPQTALSIKLMFKSREMVTLQVNPSITAKGLYRAVEGLRAFLPGFKLLHEDKKVLGSTSDLRLAPLIARKNVFRVQGQYFPLFLTEKMDFLKTLGVHHAGECVVCLDVPATHRFASCGHICACQKCIVDLGACPLCQ